MRVLAAHLGDDALDPDLPGLHLGRELVDAEADLARAGERDEARLGMAHQGVADRAAAAGHEVEHAGRQPDLLHQLRRTAQAIAGESLEGFSTTVLPVTIAAVVMPTQIASGKFQGGMTAPTPSGM